MAIETPDPLATGHHYRRGMEYMRPPARPIETFDLADRDCCRAAVPVLDTCESTRRLGVVHQGRQALEPEIVAGKPSGEASDAPRCLFNRGRVGMRREILIGHSRTLASVPRRAPRRYHEFCQAEAAD